MEHDKLEIIERFIEERKKFGTQEALAEAVGINPKTVSAYETGRKNPSLKMFIKICQTINADINYIIFGRK